MGYSEMWKSGNTNEWVRDFYKTYTTKCLIGRIKINGEVNNHWRSSRKRVAGHKASNSCADILTFGHFFVRMLFQVLLSIDQSIFAA